MASLRNSATAILIFFRRFKWINDSRVFMHDRRKTVCVAMCIMEPPAEKIRIIKMYGVRVMNGDNEFVSIR